MDEKSHSLFTGMAAKIDGVVGGEFEVMDGTARGYFLNLSKDKRIVQAWTHNQFDPGIFTIVSIDLEKTEKGTRINFNHIGVPEDSSGWLTENWKKVYWNRLKEFLEEKVLH